MAARPLLIEQLRRYFPTPRYLSPHVVGFDLSDESVKLIELDASGRTFRLKRFGEERIPLGAIQNGKIKNPDLLIRSLISVREKYNLRDVMVALPEEQAYIVKVRLPDMKHRELREAVELQLEELVPLKASEIEFDFDIVKEPSSMEPHFDLAVSVLPKTVVANYLGALNSAGINPFAFEIEGQAVARAVVPRGDTRTTMIVDFGKWRTGIAIVSAETVWFSATIAFGGVHVNKAIMDKFQVSEDQAERMKRDQSLVPKTRAQEFSDLLVTSLAVLADEINKYAFYWHDHKDETDEERTKVERVVLCGGGSNVMDITDSLRTTVGMSVELANPWVNVLSLQDSIPAIAANEALRFSTAIGLALRAMYPLR